MSPPTPRRIWLCADDYGLAPGVNTAIRDLIARGRLNATSAMVVTPHLGAAEAQSLNALNESGKRAAIGLHLTLTAPFAPLSRNFVPLWNGTFLGLPKLMRAAVLRQLRVESIAEEIAAQLKKFGELFGRLPDYVDGHQHVQLFPQIRDAFVKTVAELAPNCWVRQCGRAAPLRGIHDRKALLLDVLSVAFRRRCARQGLATNPAFAGTYAFTPDADFARLFPRFLGGLPDGGLMMCHPGFVDAELERLDPLTALREREFAFLNSDAFVTAMAAGGAVLADASGNGAKAD